METITTAPPAAQGAEQLPSFARASFARRRLLPVVGVAVVHVALIWLLLRPQASGDRQRTAQRATDTAQPFATIVFFLPPEREQDVEAVSPTSPSSVPVPRESARVRAPLPQGSSGAISLPGRAAASGPVDWPLEGEKSAARVLAAEAEAARVSRMFSGPPDSAKWASLTKRKKSKLRKFRWRPGVGGLEFDSSGNAIYHVSEGCVLVNFSILSCALGKPTVHGDLFKDMRLYFDEQRMPETHEGNGRETPAPVDHGD